MNSLNAPAPFTIGEHAWFLDLDGTLVDFGATPMDVQVSPSLLGLLGALHDQSAGALAIVSGRRIETIDQLLSPLRLPVAGLHGLERRDGAGVAHRSDVAANAAVAKLARVMREFAASDTRLFVEDKQLTVALHYRVAPDRAAAIERFTLELEQELDPKLTLQRGHSVIEVRPAGADKGTAIASFMQETPFRGRRPIFAGDDSTDEHGFVVVNAMCGVSVKIGTGSTAACARLDDPSAVRDWLARVLREKGVSF